VESWEVTTADSSLGERVQEEWSLGGKVEGRIK